VAKQRIVNTKFWDDSYITRLTPTEKLLFLYLLTNPLTNISGVYELPAKRVAFDTGISLEKAAAIVKKLEQDGKLVAVDGWVGIVNFIRHQTLNPKVKQGIRLELKRAPKNITDSLSIDYQAL
jgi:DNA-binding MarR family transcriptional regulator